MSDTIGGLWERFQGDRWTWLWDADPDDGFSVADVATWTDPVITMRRGDRTTDPLVASTTEDPATIVDLCDFANGIVGWEVLPAVTSTVTAGTVWVELEVKIDGNETTVIHHEVEIRSEIAVRP